MAIVTPVTTQTGTLGASAIADSTGGSVRTPYRPPQPRVAYPANAPANSWNGEERRNGQDRRAQPRRQGKQATPLDTRSAQDRRRTGRRTDDQPARVSLSVLA